MRSIRSERHHHGPLSSGGQREPAVYDARTGDQRLQSLYRRRTRRPRADQECGQSDRNPITMVHSPPGVSANLPFMTPELETNVSNLFIAGELGGLALIKNAVNQGRDCIDSIAERLASQQNAAVDPDVFDVVIVGAGPAGISASLRCIERKLRYLTLERDSVGGTVAKYPRQKLVMTSPVEFP